MLKPTNLRCYHHETYSVKPMAYHTQGKLNLLFGEVTCFLLNINCLKHKLYTFIKVILVIMMYQDQSIN